MDPTTPPPAPATPAGPLTISFTPEHLLPVLGDPYRYRILEIMADGQHHAAAELSRALGKSQQATANALAVMRNSGLIQLSINPRQRRATSYRLPAAFLPTPGNPRTLDFGWCVLRFATPLTYTGTPLPR